MFLSLLKKSFFFLIVLFFCNTSLGLSIEERNCLSESSRLCEKRADYPSCEKRAKQDCGRTETYQIGIEKCLRNLASEYRVKVPNKKSYLRIKDKCLKYKIETTACCSNPQSCDGLGMDLTKNLLPILPALYGTYKAIKISGQASKMTSREAAEKMCNAQNTVGLSAFASQLFLQMMPLWEGTCSDKIKKCEKDCSSELKDLKKKFQDCFEPNHQHKVQSQKFANIEKIISSANKCFYARKKVVRRSTFEAREKEKRVCLLSGHTSMKLTIVRRILDFDKAYRNSSEEKKFYYMKSLSTKSEAKEIVDCAKQPDRVVSRRKGASGGPIPPPAFNLCQNYVKDRLNELPSINNQSNETLLNTNSLTGGGEYNLSPRPGDGISELPELPEPGGLPDDDGDFESDNSPKLAQISGQGDSNSTSPSGGGGGLSAGASPGTTSASPSNDSENNYSDSFSSGEGSASFNGGGSYPQSQSYSYPDRGSDSNSNARNTASNESNTTTTKVYHDDKIEEKDDGKGINIFQIASHRIQQFCVNNDCAK